ncbi:MAG: hypothetical protein ACTS10_21820 [Kiloniellales bacterium]
MKTGTDLMGQSPLFHYRPYRRRRWTYRYRFLLIGAGLLIGWAVAILVALNS